MKTRNILWMVFWVVLGSTGASAQDWKSILGDVLQQTVGGQTLSEEDFYAPAHQVIYAAMAHLYHTGAAVDLVTVEYRQANQLLNHNFEEDPFFSWLIAHCADYGFILRYPKDKEEITGITYEPWHYRYVGEEAARYIMDNGLCLEEFWEQLPS